MIFVKHLYAMRRNALQRMLVNVLHAMVTVLNANVASGTMVSLPVYTESL